MKTEALMPESAGGFNNRQRLFMRYFTATLIDLVVLNLFAEYSDKITRHVHLMPPEAATTVRLDRGEPVVTDGPYVEGKEVVSGFAEVDVADLDEALKVAKSWPGCPVVEIRPIASA